ncbi:MAG: Lrp/AsnC ligand binding domain-containing protein [Candidatus Zixiibacteriota bacterium]
MNSGSYFLVRFDDKAQLLPAIESLGSRKQVRRWDAVDGYYNLVLRLSDKALALPDELRKLEGFSSFSRCDLIDEQDDLASIDDYPAASYLFIETEKERRREVKTALELMDAVIACAPVTGSYDLVVVIAADSFSEIERIVQRQLASLDGVLRLKQDRILRLDTL